MFFLLTLACTKEHTESEVMQDLVKTFAGETYISSGLAKDTSNYKNCKINGSVNVPFNDTALIAKYNNEVSSNYAEALQAMDIFVRTHISPPRMKWFVKAVLELIMLDGSIRDSERFYADVSGHPITKAKLMNENEIDISAFLVGILHYVLLKGQNTKGVETLKIISQQKNNGARTYTSTLGSELTKPDNVIFPPDEREAFEEASQSDVSHVSQIGKNNINTLTNHGSITFN